MKNYSRVLTIAGSDSGGGAGIQADIKTISANACFATSVITAITSQNTVGITAIYPIPIDHIQSQMRAVLSDIGTDAVKIGMLHNSQTIEAVYEVLTEYKVKNIVLDPVMVATSGNKLLQDDAIKTLQDKLIPISRIITPNLPEAEIILGKQITSLTDWTPLAKELSQKSGDVSVLLKAGHAKGDTLIDVFYNAETDESLELKSKRIHSQNTHGTGCTLSSALASFLAQGYDLNKAAKAAKNYINEAIVAGKDYKIGKGHGPVKHFYNFWEV